MHISLCTISHGCLLVKLGLPLPVKKVDITWQLTQSLLPLLFPNLGAIVFVFSPDRDGMC